MTDTEEREKSSSVLVVSVKWILSNTGTLFCNNVIIYIYSQNTGNEGWLVLYFKTKRKNATHVQKVSQIQAENRGSYT